MKSVVPLSALLVIPHLALAQGVEDPLHYQVLLRMSGGLLLVVALVFVAAWGVRRFARLPTTANRSLQLLGGIAVGQRERVVLIKAGGEHLLLGVAPGRVQMLHTLTIDSRRASETVRADPATIEAEPGDEQPSFQLRLRDLLKRGGIR